MENQELPEDFKEFLKLLNDHAVDYLLIGGYAVGYYGYPRTTADMDIWVAIRLDNAQKLVDVFQQFGMLSDEITTGLFMQPGDIVRMGLPPMRIEVLNDIDGVNFEESYMNRVQVEIEGVPVSLISLADLRRNKQASGRHKDLDDVEHLPEG
ncbi:MAG: nucleotidyltransferase [Kiritimatiellales bacterium]|nr:nucleotidyltransferase [Kiritimatiellales bacterium]MCF7863168.1 nucleotidyltransferase [Kiritimatiellales bacterium]